MSLHLTKYSLRHQVEQYSCLIPFPLLFSPPSHTQKTADRNIMLLPFSRNPEALHFFTPPCVFSCQFTHIAYTSSRAQFHPPSCQFPPLAQARQDAQARRPARQQ